MTTRQISTVAEAPSLHTYFDVCPESPDGEYVTWFRFDGKPLSEGHVMISKRDGSEAVKVCHCAATPHGGAQAGWLDDEHIYFSAGGQVQVAHVSGEIVQRCSGAIDTIHQGSHRGLTHSNCMRKCGCTPSKEQACYRVDLDDGSLHELIDRDQAYALLCEARDMSGVDIGTMNFKHTKWAPDGKRWFVVFTNEEWRGRTGRKDGPRVKAILVADDDGGNLRYIDEFGHHPNWSPDSSFIYAYAGGNGKVMRWGAEGGEAELLYQLPIEGHPALSPDGRFLVSDFHGRPGEGQAGIVLVDLEAGSDEELLRWDYPSVDWQTQHPRRQVCHPHPVWSADGWRIYYNAIDGELPQLRVIELG